MMICIPGVTRSAEILSLEEKNAYELAGHMDVLEDLSMQMTFPQALERFASGEFDTLSGNLNGGYARKAYWIHLTLQRSEEFTETAMLRLSPGYQDEVTIYIQDNDANPLSPTSYRKVLLGDHIPVNQRPVIHPDFVVPLKLRANIPVELFIRIYSNSSMSLAGKVHTPLDLEQHTYRDVVMQSGFLAVMLVIFMMNLIFFISIRDSLFLYFSLYILTVFLTTIALEGILTLIWPEVVHLASDYLVYGGIGAQVIVFSAFSIKLFHGMPGTWTLRFLHLMLLVGFLTMVAVPLGFYPYIVPVTFAGSLTIIFLLLKLSVKMLQDAPQSGLFIFLAFAISTVGYTYQLIRLLGLIPLGPAWDINTIQPANMVHIVLISLALSERLRIAERELGEASRAAEQRATELAREMTQELMDNKERLEFALATEHLSAERQHKFLTMVSHEYRTPLAIIQGNLDILEIKSGKQGTMELGTMRRAVQRLVDVMDVSLEQSRLMDPQVSAKFKSIPASVFVEKPVEAVSWMWPERKFILDMTLENERISGELPLLNTALFNLLDNAQKYSIRSTPVEIFSKSYKNHLVIEVVNRTETLDPDEIGFIFEKYQRGNLSGQIAGAGVGLWLVRQIMHQHEGTVDLEYDQQGIVTARLTMPLEVPGIS